MVAFLRRQRLKASLAPAAAIVLASLAALVIALIPAAMLESFALASGVAAVLPAAEPPLGWTARAVMILIGGGGLGILSWSVLFLWFESGTPALEAAIADAAPVLRRADAHPDAPSRRPVFANQDLGTPFLDVRATRPAAPAESVASDARDAPAGTFALPFECPIPADLDEPLAAYDPTAIRDAVSAPVRPAGRQQIFGPGERFETFELTPIVRPPARESVLRHVPGREFRPETESESGLGIAPETTASIHTLLDRLERGVARRDASAAPAAERGDAVESALVTLRRLATRG